MTLCGSSGQIVQKTNDKSVNLGKFQTMVVSATTNGPRLLYSSGDSCPKGNKLSFFYGLHTNLMHTKVYIMTAVGSYTCFLFHFLGRNQRYKSYIFMECNRSADPKDKKLTLQQVGTCSW